MNNLNKEIENRGFKIGDRVQIPNGDEHDAAEEREWRICDIYPNSDDLDASEALEPDGGLATGALMYSIMSIEGEHVEQILEIDHNELEFVSKGTKQDIDNIMRNGGGYE